MSARYQQASCQWFGATIASMMLCLGCTSPPVACQLSPPPKADLPERGISAHRGGKLGCPVNTVGAFQRAICRGVHQIELDVRATADEVIVVAHDDQVTVQDRELQISKTALAEVQRLELAPCQGEKKAQHIPTLKQALAIMPQNIWINVDIKKNDPRVGKLVAEIVAKANRFDQVIFAARDKAAPAIRQAAEGAGQKSRIANMSRELFRGQYVDATIHSCADFIQLVEVPYIPFVRGKPSPTTMDRLKGAGIQVNYSWLRKKNEGVLKNELEDLFDRGVDFILVDHAEQAMKAADTLGISPLAPRWDNHFLLPGAELPHCASTQ